MPSEQSPALLPESIDQDITDTLTQPRSNLKRSTSALPQNIVYDGKSDKGSMTELDMSIPIGEIPTPAGSFRYQLLGDNLEKNPNLGILCKIAIPPGHYEDLEALISSVSSEVTKMLHKPKNYMFDARNHDQLLTEVLPPVQDESGGSFNTSEENMQFVDRLIKNAVPGFYLFSGGRQLVDEKGPIVFLYNMLYSVIDPLSDLPS